MTIKNSLFISILILIISSCGQIKQEETKIIQSDQKGLSSAVSLSTSFFIKDSLKHYDIQITARMTPEFKLSSLPLRLILKDPLENTYSDTLKLGVRQVAGNPEIKKTGLWTDYRWRYREDVSFNRRGKWLFTFKHIHTKDIKGIKEIGVTLRER